MSSTSAWVIALHNIALSWGCMGETKTYSKLRLSLVFGAGDPHIVMIRPLMNQSRFIDVGLTQSREVALMIQF